MQARAKKFGINLSGQAVADQTQSKDNPELVINPQEFGLGKSLQIMDSKRNVEVNKNFDGVELKSISIKNNEVKPKQEESKDAPQKQPIKTKQELEAELQKIKDRMQKFGMEPTGEVKKNMQKLERQIAWKTNKDQPKEIQQGSQVIETSLYLYGTDFMSTGDVNKYFSIFDPKQVQWINDSSCVVSFEDPTKCALAYEKST